MVCAQGNRWRSLGAHIEDLATEIAVRSSFRVSTTKKRWRYRGSGLPVGQLLKMLANEDIDLATFKQLTKHVVGCDEDVPIELGEDDPPATEAEAPAPETNAAATAPAAAAHVPTAVEGDSDSEDKDDEEEEEAEDDDDDDAEEAAAARAPLPWGEAEAEAEAERRRRWRSSRRRRSRGHGEMAPFLPS